MLTLIYVYTYEFRLENAVVALLVEIMSILIAPLTILIVSISWSKVMLQLLNDSHLGRSQVIIAG